MTSNQRKAEAYHVSNIEAARIIAADRQKYPRVMQVWARRVLGNTPALDEFKSEAVYE